MIGIMVIFSMATTLLPIYILRHESILSPLIFLGLIVFLSNPFRYFIITTYHEELSKLQWYLASYEIEDFMIGAFITSIGLVFLTLGYLSMARRAPLPKLFSTTHEKITNKRLIVVGMISCTITAPLTISKVLGAGSVGELSRKRGVVEDGVRYAMGYQSLIIELAFVFALIATSIYFQRGRQRTLGTLAIMVVALAVTILELFASQNRSGIPVALLALILAASVVSGKIRWRPLIFGLVAVSMVFVLMTEIRKASRPNVAYKYEKIVGHLSGPERFAISIGGAYNMAGFVANSHASFVVPEVLDYRHGTTFTDALTRPVPRRLWPEKPVALGQVWVVALRGGRFDEAVAGGGGSSGLMAEGLLNFGWLGVPLTMFVFGILLRCFYEASARIGVNAPLNIALMVYIFSRLPQTMYGRDFAAGLVTIGSGFVLVFAIGSALAMFSRNRMVS